MSMIPDGQRELRAVPMQEATVTETKGGDLLFEGYAAVYNEPSERMNVRSGGQVHSFVETNAPGAFDSILASDPDVRMLGLNHDVNHVLARTKAGTLTLTSDQRGLKSAASMAPTTYAHDLRMSVERGDVDAMSYGFAAGEDTWDESDPVLAKRTIRSYSALFDVSPVTFPAFTQTSAQFRSLAGLQEALLTGELTVPEVRAMVAALEGSAAEEAGETPAEEAAEECPACAGSGDCAACAGTGKTPAADAAVEGRSVASKREIEWNGTAYVDIVPVEGRSIARRREITRRLKRLAA